MVRQMKKWFRASKNDFGATTLRPITWPPVGQFSWNFMWWTDDSNFVGVRWGTLFPDFGFHLFRFSCRTKQWPPLHDLGYLISLKMGFKFQSWIFVKFQECREELPSPPWILLTEGAKRERAASLNFGIWLGREISRDPNLKFNFGSVRDPKPRKLSRWPRYRGSEPKSLSHNSLIPDSSQHYYRHVRACLVWSMGTVQLPCHTYIQDLQKIKTF